MKLRLFGPGGRVWRLAFRIKHTAKSLKYRQLYNIKGLEDISSSFSNKSCKMSGAYDCR